MANEFFFIRELLIKLEKAKWKAIKEQGFAHLVDWEPSTHEELEIWNEITASQHYEQLVSHVQLSMKKGINSAAEKLYKKAIDKATQNKLLENKAAT